MRHRTLLLAFFACLSLAMPSRAGETGIRFMGIGADVGVVNPDDTDTAFLFGGHLGLGSLYKSWLDFAVGATYWTADRDGGPGELRDFRVHGDLRLNLVKASGVQPFALGGFSAHFVGADIPGNPALEDALGGFNAGIDLGFGIASTQGSLGLSVEFRRQFVDDVDNWSITAGIGYRRREAPGQ